MKKIVGLVLSLTVIAGVCAAVLASVDAVTRSRIAEIRLKQERDAVRAVMPSLVVGDPYELSDKPGVYAGTNAQGKVIGYATKGLDAGGYGGEIELMVGFWGDRDTIVCYRTLRATETPGLGMNLNAPEFKKQFTGMDAGSLKVKKDGGQVEAITSATITSRAVCRAIAAARGKLH